MAFRCCDYADSVKGAGPCIGNEQLKKKMYSRKLIIFIPI